MEMRTRVLSRAVCVGLGPLSNLECMHSVAAFTVNSRRVYCIVASGNSLQ